LSRPSPEEFRAAVLAHYAAEGRRLPWRETRSAYEILVSEAMLQQTQVARVLPKYAEFLAKFPGIGDLAAAGLAEVLAAWKGLGYNSRAKRLRECARAIVERHGGEVPSDPAVLRALPGIGAYTAGAVACFAYGRAEAFIETNIRSAFIHFFFQDSPRVSDAEIMPLVERCLDRENPREWYYALMDYGAALKARLGNPGRKGAAYRRQSAFKGSRREARAGALALVVERGRLGYHEIAEGTGFEEERLRGALASLVAEGLLSEEGGAYSVGEGLRIDTAPDVD
jgi:A/G-specific adenine glycosylase